MQTSNKISSTASLPLPYNVLKEEGFFSSSALFRVGNPPFYTFREIKIPNYPVRNSFLRALVMVIKQQHLSYGRTRIRKALCKYVRGSERTIGRILEELGIQNPPKRLGPPVKLTLTIPEELEPPEDPLKLNELGNAKSVLPFLFRDELGSKIEGKVSNETIEDVERYTFTLLANERLNYSTETIPFEIVELFYEGKLSDPKKIRKALYEIGTSYEELVDSILPKRTPKALAIDENVREKWIKKEITVYITNNPSLGNHYISRRGKALPSVSTDVVAGIDEEGIAQPIYFQATPASHHKIENNITSKAKETGTLLIIAQKERNPQITHQESPQNPNSARSSHGGRKSVTNKKRKTASKKKGKRCSYVIALLEVVMSLVGQIPLRMDNGYGLIPVVKWLNERGWLFIVHGKSNLKIARHVKGHMRVNGLRYYKEKIFDEKYGGWIIVVGYHKRKNVHIYLTNEEGTAKEIIKRYRHRWRIENLFKWCPALALLPGTDPHVHKGHQFVIYFFMSQLVRRFHASLPTIERLLNQRSQTTIVKGHLTAIFPRLSNRYYKILQNFVTSLPSRWQASVCR